MPLTPRARCELYLLAATWWRDALEQVLPTLLAPDRAAGAARMILRDNALSVYGLNDGETRTRC